MNNDVLELFPSEEDILLMTPPEPPELMEPSRISPDVGNANTREGSSPGEGSSSGSQSRVNTTAPPPRRKPTCLDELEYEVRTLEGVWFYITHGEYGNIPFAHIRGTKRKRYTVHLRNGDSVKVKLVGTHAPMWYGYKTQSNRRRNNPYN